MPTLDASRVVVQNLCRAPVRPVWLQELLVTVTRVPEVSARLPKGWGMAIRLTDDRELRGLHATFMGEDTVTDVLSFPAGEDTLERSYIGDVAISWPAVERQADTFGHESGVELALLCVHGLLHLLGWDHSELDEEEEMTRVTRQALAEAGLELAPGRL